MKGGYKRYKLQQKYMMYLPYSGQDLDLEKMWLGSWHMSDNDALTRDNHAADLERLFPAEDLAARSILLDVTDTGQPCFTADLPGGASVASSAQAALGGKFVDPRAALFLLPWEEACTMSQVSFGNLAIRLRRIEKGKFSAF